MGRGSCSSVGGRGLAYSVRRAAGDADGRGEARSWRLETGANRSQTPTPEPKHHLRGWMASGQGGTPRRRSTSADPKVGPRAEVCGQMSVLGVGCWCWRYNLRSAPSVRKCKEKSFHNTFEKRCEI